jgi:hypothetical protein
MAKSGKKTKTKRKKRNQKRKEKVKSKLLPLAKLLAPKIALPRPATRSVQAKTLKLFFPPIHMT